MPAGDYHRLHRSLMFLLVGLTVFPSTAHAAEQFAVSVTTNSSASVVGGETVEASNVLVVTRLSSKELHETFFGLTGRVKDASVHRFEASVLLYEDKDNLVRTLPPEPAETIVAVGAFRLNYAGADKAAAVALAAEQLQARSVTGNLSITGSARDPHSVPRGDEPTYGNKAPLNESGAGWKEPGGFVVVRPPTMEAQGSGKFRLYWFQGTVEVSGSDGQRRLESRVWDEPVAGTNDRAVVKRNFLWHELRANESEFDFTFRHTSDSVNTLLFAKRIVMASVTSVSFDSAELVDGSLPQSSGGPAPSLWIRGEMQTRAEPVHEDASRSSRYVVGLQGHAESYAYGGGGAIQWSNAPASASILVVIFLAVLYFMRETVWHGFARITLPLFAKLRKDDILRHPARDTLFRLVQENMGATFSQLRQAYGKAVGRKVGIYPLYHHLLKLGDFGYIHSRREGRARHFFAVGSVHNGDAERVSLLKATPVGEIARQVRERPGSSLVELLADLAKWRALSRSTLQYHLGRLVRAQLVSVRRRGRVLTYEATENLARLLPHARSPILVPALSSPEPGKREAGLSPV